ncbi:MAG: efflux RND transporter periplasmic adaptor subunit, partial [Patescibacteria group bacterium]|nr:efflux RND transporter periplasmic adaptor subunit [Patescibacteria group bacterium]
IIISTIVLFGAWFVWQRYTNDDKSESVDSYIISSADITETISASGELKPIEYANLSFVSPALVKTVNVEVGDRVKKGQKLMILDRNSLYAEIQSARISVEKAEAAERLARRHWDNYKPEEKEQIRKDVEQARTRLYGAQSQLTNTEVVSPIDGIVTQKNVRVGEVAQGLAIRVIDDSAMNIEILMSETDAAKMHEGQDAFAIFDAYNDEEYSVSITSINPEATKVQDVTYYKTKFTAPNNIDKVTLSGMSVDVDVIVNQKDNALTIPLRFVRKDDEGEYVFVMDIEGKYQKRYITTGIEGDEGDVEVVEGLSGGDVVYAVREEDIENI